MLVVLPSSHVGFEHSVPSHGLVVASGRPPSPPFGLMMTLPPSLVDGPNWPPMRSTFEAPLHPAKARAPENAPKDKQNKLLRSIWLPSLQVVKEHARTRCLKREAKQLTHRTFGSPSFLTIYG